MLHTVAQKTGSTAHCDLGVSDGHLSAVARQVSQFLLLFHLTPGDAEVCIVNVHMQGVVRALREKKERLFFPAVHLAGQAENQRSLLEELVGDTCPV